MANEESSRGDTRSHHRTGYPLKEVGSVFAGFTAAMNHEGVCGNFAPRPFAQVSPEAREKVGVILRELGLI
ncbi:MAG TPA: hypothetical protein PLP42_08020 [Acidobacteriota bacterium]|nr:hypothetical protein [Acidobacteriota bacterium]